ncbi:hypothetical protein B1H29_14820 [Streptomyces pactum]|uniref:Uncharacterized protein n=1 Tax=Streptomyces pactum TaxID=68249 RepID=A0A1S6J8H4_9ACTN|nr:hypothetical protein B1H29_14820 [Streptomyces pactum]
MNVSSRGPRADLRGVGHDAARQGGDRAFDEPTAKYWSELLEVGLEDTPARDTWREPDEPHGERGSE